MSFQLALREAYETSFGIHDHDDPSRTGPLALVEHRETEDCFSWSLVCGSFARFADNPVIRDVWGLDIEQFLELPKCYSDEILRLSIEISQDRETRADRLEQDALRGRKPNGFKTS